jgi:hypothetical protein
MIKIILNIFLQPLCSFNFFDRQDTAQCFAREVSFLEWKSTEEILQAGAWK